MWNSICWYEDLALGVEWAFGEEMSRLDLEAVEGDDANNYSGLTNFSQKKRLEDPNILLGETEC